MLRVPAFFPFLNWRYQGYDITCTGFEGLEGNFKTFWVHTEILCLISHGPLLFYANIHAQCLYTIKKKKKDKFNPAAAHFACCYMKLLNVIYFLWCLVVTSLLIDACVETP